MHKTSLQFFHNNLLLLPVETFVQRQWYRLRMRFDLNQTMCNDAFAFNKRNYADNHVEFYFITFLLRYLLQRRDASCCHVQQARFGWYWFQF